MLPYRQDGKSNINMLSVVKKSILLINEKMINLSGETKLIIKKKAHRFENWKTVTEMEKFTALKLKWRIEKRESH